MIAAVVTDLLMSDRPVVLEGPGNAEGSTIVVTNVGGTLTSESVAAAVELATAGGLAIRGISTAKFTPTAHPLEHVRDADRAIDGVRERARPVLRRVPQRLELTHVVEPDEPLRGRRSPGCGRHPAAARRADHRIRLAAGLPCTAIISPTR